jgi:DNA-binding transcriptional MerR regulator
MTITATRPLRLTPDDAKILAAYAGGDSAADICTATGFSLARVGRVLDEHAGNNRELAHQVVHEYAEQAQAVAAAKGTSPAAAAAAALPRPATRIVPAPAAAPAAEPADPAVPEAIEPAAAAPDEPDAVAADEVGLLLEQADATGDPRLQRATVKIRELVDGLRTDLAEHLREKRLRDEMARLEARLAEVKQQLRPRRGQPVLDTATADPEPAVDSKVVRAWALEQGLACPKVGRVPGDVVAAYRQAHTGAGQAAAR